MSELPLASVERIMRASGAERVSSDAVEELRDAIEEFAEAVAEASVQLAKHAGRVTIKAEDVKLAAR